MTTEQRPRAVTPTPASTIEVVSTPYGLSKDEMDVLFLLREGLFVPQIAEVLLVPQSAVEERVGSLLTKMDARSKTEAAVRAIREGLFNRQ